MRWLMLGWLFLQAALPYSGATCPGGEPACLEAAGLLAAGAPYQAQEAPQPPGLELREFQRAEQDGREWYWRNLAAEDGGPDWMEVYENGKLGRWREVTDREGTWKEIRYQGESWRERRLEGDWLEIVKHGRRFRARQTASGLVEVQDGGSRWTVRPQAQDEARRLGVTWLELPADSPPIQVFGGASCGELKVLGAVLGTAPAAASPLVREIYLCHDLGEGAGGRLEGLAVGDQILLDRDNLEDPTEARTVLYHELGHLLDGRGGTHRSTRAPWGQGRSVSAYGRVSALEDFAETHRVVLEEWGRLTALDPREWVQEECAEKKREILELYGESPDLRLTRTLIEGPARPLPDPRSFLPPAQR